MLGIGDSQRLYQWLPLFRTPKTIAGNRQFLVLEPTKAAVLDTLAHGLRGDWGTLPTPGLHVRNFLKTPAAVSTCRARFKSEVSLGRMLGGPG